MINDYHFISRWRVEGTCGEVADIIGDPLALTRWWPSVYLKVDELRPPDARGLGRRVRLETAGWLPYTIHWEFEVVESRYPYGFSIVASGDFDGRGEWTFLQDGPIVDITYDWRRAPRSRCSATCRSCSSRSSRRTIAGRWRAGTKA